jgi:predicted nucleic acid-binding protein
VKYVLDTDIVTRLPKGDERVLSHLTDVEPRNVGIPLLVLAELLFGVEKSVRKVTTVLPPSLSRGWRLAARAGVGVDSIGASWAGLLESPRRFTCPGIRC